MNIRVAFFLALISIFVFHFKFHFRPFVDRIKDLEPKNQNQNLTETIRVIEEETPKRNYIVRFFYYKKADDHKIYLLENLGLFDGWKWIDRRNPASSFPTDFGLVSIEQPVQSSLIEELGKLGLVKDVSVDLSYSRSLFAKDERKGGSFVNGKKRPGKIFTSMSFSEREYHSPLSNSSISWQRKLMMEVNFICSSDSFLGNRI